MKQLPLKIIAVVALLLFAAEAWAWHDKTHLMIAKAAGRTSWYNAAGPDLAKIKAGHIESYNHWYNNNALAPVTPQMVFAQIDRYNERNRLLDAEGHLYGAILASLRTYDTYVRSGKYAEYHLDYCAHYIFPTTTTTRPGTAPPTASLKTRSGTKRTRLPPACTTLG